MAYEQIYDKIAEQRNQWDIIYIIHNENHIKLDTQRKLLVFLNIVVYLMY